MRRYQPSAISYQLSAISNQLSAISHQLSVPVGFPVGLCGRQASEETAQHPFDFHHHRERHALSWLLNQDQIALTELVRIRARTRIPLQSSGSV